MPIHEGASAGLVPIRSLQLWKSKIWDVLHTKHGRSTVLMHTGRIVNFLNLKLIRSPALNLN